MTNVTLNLQHLRIAKIGLLGILCVALLNMVGNFLITMKINVILGLSSVVLSALMSFMCMIGIYVTNICIIEVRLENACNASKNWNDDIEMRDQDYV